MKKTMLLIWCILIIANMNVLITKAETYSSEKEIVVTYGKCIKLNDVIDLNMHGENNLQIKGNCIQINKNTLKATGVGEGKVSVSAVDGLGYTHVETLTIKIIPTKVTKVKLKRSVGKKAAKYDSVLLQWKKQKNASYAIYRSKSKNTGYKKVGVLKNSYWKEIDYGYVQWVDTSKIKHGVKYYYKIRAFYKKGGSKIYGAYSKPKKAAKWKKTRVTADYVALPEVNKKRKKNGLRPLLWDFKADKGTKLRAKEIEKSLSHTRPNGKDCMTAYNYIENNSCFNHYAFSENIASGCWGKAAVKAYMRSPGHRSLILCNLTEDEYLPYGAECSSGKTYEEGEVMPGDVCGMSMWTNDYKESGVGNAFVFTVMKNLSGR